MPESKTHRLRLKLPNGAEIEVEGSPDFITSERREFTGMLQPRRAEPAPETLSGPLEPAWEEIIECRGHDIQLRAKLGGNGSERDACIILIAAARALLSTPKPTAAQLARWLRKSGYPILRVDRAISAAVSKGEILASGSRRARRYELSGPGLAKAFNLAFDLKRLISP